MGFQKCLDKNPSSRWSCEELIMHPYFQNFKFKVDESEISPEKLSRDRSRVSDIIS